MTGPDEPTARWLTSAAGLAVVERTTAALDAGEDALQVADRLSRDGIDTARRAAAVDAAVCRRRARDRWPEAERLLFTRQALEQASDPAVAAHRARSLLARAAVSFIRDTGPPSRWWRSRAGGQPITNHRPR